MTFQAVPPEAQGLKLAFLVAAALLLSAFAIGTAEEWRKHGKIFRIETF
ncbi:hypothetical protein KBZ16_12930 [Vulcanococcus limneticus Candia 3B3]|nr:hypothetical protein [Vulcanococcus limneticus Candia 3B3]